MVACIQENMKNFNRFLFYRFSLGHGHYDYVFVNYSLEDLYTYISLIHVLKDHSIFAYNAHQCFVYL